MTTVLPDRAGVTLLWFAFSSWLSSFIALSCTLYPPHPRWRLTVPVNHVRFFPLSQKLLVEAFLRAAVSLSIIPCYYPCVIKVLLGSIPGPPAADPHSFLHDGRFSIFLRGPMVSRLDRYNRSLCFLTIVYARLIRRVFGKENTTLQHTIIPILNRIIP